MPILQQIQQGFFYFKAGWQLIAQGNLRRFVIIPVLLNILLLSGLFYVFVHQIDAQIQSLMHVIPTWLSWLSGLFYFVAIALILLVYYFTFNTLSGFIAAPFNGLLAEKVEQMLTGVAGNDDGIWALIHDIPRTMQREWVKVVYLVPRILALFLLGFVPVLGQFVVPLLIFLFNSWSQAVQYCDYPFDNHKVSFPNMKSALKTQPYMNLTFGALVMLCTFIPFINFVIIPVATCGATQMWVENYRSQFIKKA